MINKKLAKLMTEKPIKADVSIAENKLYLYGTIGDNWDGVTLDDVKNTVEELDKSKVTVYINSYGGDAAEGVAIRNFLKETFGKIDVVIDGIAASAASVIATCGDTLFMPTGTTYMIHNPWTIVLGDREELLKGVNALESLETSYRNIYMERFTGTEDELIELMDNESWLTADEAEKLGFATQKEDSNPDENETTEENALVANLLNKYVASTESNVNKNISNTKREENNFLNNLTKTFSQI
jgi:ATP-dependent protease ClpP protease subunit